MIDTGFTDGGPSHIRVFDCDIEAGKLTNGKVFADGFAPDITSGMRCDVDGNVWCSKGWADPKEDGVRCYSSSGDLLARSICRRPAPICALADRSGTDCSSAAAHRSRRFTSARRVR